MAEGANMDKIDQLVNLFKPPMNQALPPKDIKWKDLAWGLGLKPEAIKKFEMKRRDTRRPTSFEELLVEWRDSRGDGATAEELIDAFAKIGADNVADYLKNAIQNENVPSVSHSQPAATPKQAGFLSRRENCILLAHHFANMVCRYAGFIAEDLCPPIRPPDVSERSISAMFRKMLDKRIENFIKLNRPKFSINKNHLVQKHSLVSLSILYPEAVDKFKKYMDLGNITDDHLAAVAIAHPSFQLDERAYAEYFIAVFFHKSLNNVTEWSSEHTSFLLETLLSTTPQRMYSFLEKEVLINTNSFQNRMFCRFLDSLLMEDFPFFRTRLFGEVTMDKVQALCNACVCGDFFNIFKLFDRSKMFEGCEKEIFGKELVWMSASNSELDLLKMICEKFTEYTGTPVNQIRIEGLSVLHIAVQDGVYNKIAYLLNHQGFKGLLMKELSSSESHGWLRGCVCGTSEDETLFDLHGLLHECIEGSSEHDDSFKIYEKIDVIKLLCGINKELVEERDNQGCTPILCRNAHPRLVVEVIGLGADVEVVNNHGETVLHTTARNMHDSLLKHIPMQTLEKIVNLKDWEGYTPVHRMVTYKDPDPRVLDLLQVAGADFNSVNLEGESVIESALRNMRSLECVKELMNRCGGGGLAGWSNKDKLTILKAAVETGHSHVLEYLGSAGITVEGMGMEGVYREVGCHENSDSA